MESSDLDYQAYVLAQILRDLLEEKARIHDASEQINAYELKETTSGRESIESGGPLNIVEMDMDGDSDEDEEADEGQIAHRFMQQEKRTDGSKCMGFCFAQERPQIANM